jgi:hypothetical protein
MLFVLLLQISQVSIFPLSDMERFTAEAAKLLRVSPIPEVLVASKTSNPIALANPSNSAWVRMCVGCPNTITIKQEPLTQSHKAGLRYFAYHETCHLYLGNQRTTDEFQTQVIEEAARACTVVVFDRLYPGGFEVFARDFPCSPFVPSHVIEYNQSKRREICARN